MVAISAIIGVLLVIVLFLRIAQMTGGVKTTITTMQGTFDEHGNFLAGPPPPVPLPLPKAEFDRQADLMPTEWITYMGATPPLRLKIRGTTEMMYRQASRKYINLIGQENFMRLSNAEKAAATRAINAEIYVLDWEGAFYPNGNAMPFSPSALAILLEKDEHLNAFLSDQVARISPAWTGS